MNLKTVAAVFAVALAFGWSLNEANLSSIRRSNPANLAHNTASTVFDTTVYSVDNSFYLDNARNLLAGNGYTLDPANKEMSVRRTPGYPLFYAAHQVLFGERGAHLAIRYTQLLLFALSAALLGLAVFNLSSNRSWALATATLYAVSPFSAGYLYFTITESISPALVILSFYVFSLAKRDRSAKNLALLGAAIALCFLSRPLTGVILPAYMICFVDFRRLLDSRHLKELFATGVWILVNFALILSPWVVRNYAVTGELIVAEKYYYGAPMKFGRAYIAFRYLVSGWTNPANLNTERIALRLQSNIRDGGRDQNVSDIEEFVADLPTKAFQGYTGVELRDALIDLEKCFSEKHDVLAANPAAKLAVWLNLDCEDETRDSFTELTGRFKKTAPLQYYMLTPLATMNQFVFQSNSYHIRALHPEVGGYYPHQLAAKGAMYGLNVLLFLSALSLVLFRVGPIAIRLVVATSTGILLMALTVVLFRYVESRYLLPIYPFLYIAFGFYVALVVDKVRHLRQRKHASGSRADNMDLSRAGNPVRQ